MNTHSWGYISGPRGKCYLKGTLSDYESVAKDEHGSWVLRRYVDGTLRGAPGYFRTAKGAMTHADEDRGPEWIMNGAVVRQCPGWWPALVRVECDACGYVGDTIDLNARPSMHVYARLSAEEHDCGEC